MKSNLKYKKFEMPTTKNEQINKAVVVLKELSADEKLRRQIELREKAEHDYTSQMKTARNEGRVEGERAILNNLIASGFDVGSLSKALKIPVSELNKIAYKTKSGEIYEIEPEM